MREIAVILLNFAADAEIWCREFERGPVSTLCGRFEKRQPGVNSLRKELRKLGYREQKSMTLGKMFCSTSFYVLWIDGKNSLSHVEMLM